MVFIYLCATIFLLLFTWHTRQHYSKLGWTINKIPGLPPIPIIGNLLSFAVPPDKVWSKIHYLFNKYDSMFRFWGVFYPAVFMCHPEDLKILLSCKKNINKSYTPYNNIRYSNFDGIISSNAERWQHRRKILNYAFTSNHLEIYTEKVNQRANKLAVELKSRGDTFVENVASVFLKFALAAVCDAVMDFDTDSMPAEKEKEFREAVDEFFQISLYRALRPYILNFMVPYLPVGWRLARVNKVLNSFGTRIIDERRKYHECVGYNIFENGMDNAENAGTIKNGVKGWNKKLAVIDLLLLAEKKNLMESHGIIEEVFTFTAAGYETTGMAISFLLTLLAEHKEQQNLARAEILEILGNDDYITLNHIKQMDYLDRCVKESLRLFPTAPHVGRNITNDIRFRKHTIPHGAAVCISFYDLHRNHEFWSEPDKFDPDRFLPENVKQRHPFAYLPFSAGPRSCIGKQFATTEIKLVAAYILYNFHLEPVDVIADLNLEMHFTIKANEIKLKFIRINRD